MVSIIVPVYNVEKYVRRCIDSILQQKDVNFELILIDDGSTDKSGEICEQYIKDKRVNVIHQTNQGVAAARNVGIEASKGEYLWFIDSDDWIAEGALSCLINNGRDSDVIVCGSYNAKEIDDRNFIITQGVYWPDKSEPFIVSDKYAEVFNKNGSLWNKLIKKSIVGNVRFDENKTYAEDADFLCNIMPKVKTGVIVPFNLYYYFFNRQGNVVSSKNDKRSLELLENTKSIYDKLAAFGQGPSGVKRIIVDARAVLNKVPLTFDGIKDNKLYIKAARETLTYPKLQDVIGFYLDRTIYYKLKILYFLILINPLHMQCWLLRRNIIDFMNKEINN